MNRAISFEIMIALAATLSFADTIHLRDGQEVEDAVVIEVGINDIKYKLGEKEVIYTLKKSDIAIIFYKDGTKEVFKNTDISSSEAKDKYENFTTGQRWGTWALNALTINGLGSFLVMGDVTGGFIHLGFGVASVLLALNAPRTSSCSGYGYTEYCEEETDLTLFSIVYLSGAIWNIYRSASYDKPKNVAYSKYGNFNMAVLPNRHGSLNAYLMYNKAF